MGCSTSKQLNDENNTVIDSNKSTGKPSSVPSFTEKPNVEQSPNNDISSHVHTTSLNDSEIQLSVSPMHEGELMPRTETENVENEEHSDIDSLSSLGTDANEAYSFASDGHSSARSMKSAMTGISVKLTTDASSGDDSDEIVGNDDLDDFLGDSGDDDDIVDLMDDDLKPEVGDASNATDLLEETHTQSETPDTEEGREWFSVMKHVLEEADLTVEMQEQFLTAMETQSYEDGAYIVRQGDIGDQFFVIQEGIVTVEEQKEEDEPPLVLSRLYPGHHFGEFSLLREQPRVASVVARGSVICKYITKDVFRSLLAGNSKFETVIHKLVEETEQTRRKRDQLLRRGTGKTRQVAFVRTEKTSTRITQTVKRYKNDLGITCINNYALLKKLGSGMYGEVYLCRENESRRAFAMKIVDKIKLRRKRFNISDEVLMQEVEVMKMLRHPNVVAMTEVMNDARANKLYMVQEYVQNGPVMTESDMQPLDESVVRKYFRDILRGLEYLHFQRVIHRDIKPDNILISDDMTAKLADFGVATVIPFSDEELRGYGFTDPDVYDDTLTDVQGTPAFMAPELFRDSPRYKGRATDVWALGATLYTLIVGAPPFMAANEMQLVEKLLGNDVPAYPKNISPHLRHLLQRMLTKEPEQRITVPELMAHEWTTQEGTEPLPRTNYIRIGMPFQTRNNRGLSMDADLGSGDKESTESSTPQTLDTSCAQNIEENNGIATQSQENPAITFGGRRRRRRASIVQVVPKHSMGEGQKPDLSTFRRRSSRLVINRDSSSRVLDIRGRKESNAAAKEKAELQRLRQRQLRLLKGHAGLSARDKDMLMEQQRIAIHKERAKVTVEEIFVFGDDNSAINVSTQTLDVTASASIDMSSDHDATDSTNNMELNAEHAGSGRPPQHHSHSASRPSLDTSVATDVSVFSTLSSSPKCGRSVPANESLADNGRKVLLNSSSEELNSVQSISRLVGIDDRELRRPASVSSMRKSGNMSVSGHSRGDGESRSRDAIRSLASRTISQFSLGSHGASVYTSSSADIGRALYGTYSPALQRKRSVQSTISMGQQSHACSARSCTGTPPPTRKWLFKEAPEGSHVKFLNSDQLSISTNESVHRYTPGAALCAAEDAVSLRRTYAHSSRSLYSLPRSASARSIRHSSRFDVLAAEEGFQFTPVGELTDNDFLMSFNDGDQTSSDHHKHLVPTATRCITNSTCSTINVSTPKSSSMSRSMSMISKKHRSDEMLGMKDEASMKGPETIAVRSCSTQPKDTSAPSGFVETNTNEGLILRRNSTDSLQSAPRSATGIALTSPPGEKVIRRLVNLNSRVEGDDTVQLRNQSKTPPISPPSSARSRPRRRSVGMAPLLFSADEFANGEHSNVSIFSKHRYPASNQMQPSFVSASASKLNRFGSRSSMRPEDLTDRLHDAAHPMPGNNFSQASMSNNGMYSSPIGHTADGVHSKGASVHTSESGQSLSVFSVDDGAASAKSAPMQNAGFVNVSKQRFRGNASHTSRYIKPELVKSQTVGSALVRTQSEYGKAPVMLGRASALGQSQPELHDLSKNVRAAPIHEGRARSLRRHEDFVMVTENVGTSQGGGLLKKAVIFRARGSGSLSIATPSLSTSSSSLEAGFASTDNKLRRHSSNASPTQNNTAPSGTSSALSPFESPRNEHGTMTQAEAIRKSGNIQRLASSGANALKVRVDETIRETVSTSSSSSDLSSLIEDDEEFEDVTDRLDEVLADLDAQVQIDKDLEPLSDVEIPDSGSNSSSSDDEYDVELVETGETSFSRLNKFDRNTSNALSNDEILHAETRTTPRHGRAYSKILHGSSGKHSHTRSLLKLGSSDHSHLGLGPLKAPEDAYNAALKLKFGVAEDQGKRSTMEDRMMALVEFNAAMGIDSQRAQQAFFGVYDGHNGDHCSRMLSERLHMEYARAPTFDEDTSESLIHAFCETDDAYCEWQEKEAARLGNNFQFSGSTGIVMVARWGKLNFQSLHAGSQNRLNSSTSSNEEGLALFIANAGDCRAVLSQHGIAIDLSEDHKASREDEKRRIEAAGGYVHNGRLMGVLAVSRAFGDVEHKNLKQCAWETEFHDDPLIAEPDIRVEVVDPTDEFVILACDGVWDVLTSQQAVNFVRRRLVEHSDIQKAAEELVQKAIALNSVDNVSVVIVCFHQDSPM